MSRITVQYSDVIVNFGYDRPLNGFWADVFSAHPVDTDYEKQDREPLHEFPSTYPFRLADSIASIRADLRAIGIELPTEAILALNIAGHEFGGDVYFETNLDYLAFSEMVQSDRKNDHTDGRYDEEIYAAAQKKEA